MGVFQAKTKSKTHAASAADNQAKQASAHKSASAPRPVSAQARAYYSAPPVHTVSLPVQTKVAIGRANDPYEREADTVADRVVAGQPATSISSLPAGGLGSGAQRQEEKEEAAQAKPVQRQEEDTEASAQSAPVQRQDDTEPEETAQTALVQRQEEEEGQESTQMAPLPGFVQRQEEEGEESAQPAPLLQRQEETEEPTQTATVQRQEEGAEGEETEEEGEAVQAQRLQRQEEAPEEPAQAEPVQRQEEEEGVEAAQADSVQQQEEDAEAPVQELPLQRESEEESEGAVQSRSTGALGPPASPAMHATASRAIHSRGAGEPVNVDTRHKLESSMNVDLSDVRVHEDSSARQAAGGLKARAFTQKNHIWLGHGQSQSNVHLMAHETTHVLQQGGVVRRKPLDEETEEPEKRSEEDRADVPEATAIRVPRRPEAEIPPPPAATEAREQPEPKAPAPKGTEAPPSAAVVTPATAEPIKATQPPGEEEAEAEEKAAAQETAAVETPAPAEASEAAAPVRPGPAVEVVPPVAVPEGASGQAAVEREVAEAPTPEGTKAKGEAQPAPEVKMAPEKEPVVSEAEKAKVEEKAAEEAPAPPSPEEDPRFQGVMGRLEKLSSKEKSHEPAKKKVSAARAAAEPPKNDRSSRAQANQVGVMDQQEGKKPDKEDFLTLLRKAIQAIAPKSMEETEEFKKKGKAGQLKATLNTKVNQQKQDSERDIKSAAETEPNPESVEAKQVTPIPGEPSNPRQAKLKSKDVLPEPKTDEDVSVEHNKKKAGQLMAENDIDDEQLERANEPQFSEALKSKKEMEAHADQVPTQYREAEQGHLSEAEAAVKAEEKAAKDAMRAKREKGKDAVKGRQQAAKKEEEERKRVADDIQQMYQATKKSVEGKLNGLDSEVNTLFDVGEKRARDRFESHVDQRMRAYKYDRYISKIGGSLLWAKDKIFGMPDEVNAFYEEGRDLYIKDMDTVLVKIADTVETRLKEAKDEIVKGKKKIAEYVEALPKNLQKAGKDAQKDVSSQFDDLEEGVESKKQDLAQSMAKRYQESRKKLDERIEELKKANQGLLDAFIGKIKEIIEILRNFKNRVSALMSQAGDVLRKIVKDPGKFLDNLSAALKKGFNQFIGNFLKHLKGAFISWLFGTMSKAGIEIPSEFTFKGVFGVILQIMGITKDWIRSRVVKYIGAKNVERIEKAWSIVSTFISGGIGGLWEKAKQYLGDLRDKLFDTIQNWLITQIVKQAVIWVLSLLNPVSALLKIIKMIYDVVMFFVENIGRILQLVEAVVQSTAKIVAGNIGAAANWIESAMARTLPIIISFLARILGISGIANKIKQFIKNVQKKVRKAVDKVLKKIVMGIRKLIGKGKAAYGKGKAVVKKVAKKAKSWIRSLRPKKFSMSGRSHSLSASVSGGKPKIMMSSSRAEVLISKIDKASKATDDQGIKASLITLRSDAETIQGVLESAQSITDAKKQKKEEVRYSKKIKEFSLKIGKFGADNKLDDLIPVQNIADEGKVESYSTFGKQKVLVADHEPQNSLLKVIKTSVKFTRPGNTSKLKVFGKNTSIAKYSEGQAIAMNMHVSRHAETRTFKSDGRVALDEARVKMGADTSWVIATTGSTADTARNEAQENVKNAVSEALKDDRGQVEKIYRDKKWKLSDTVKDRVINATPVVKSKNKSKWPEVFK